VVNHIGDADKSFAKFLIDSGVDEQPSDLSIKPHSRFEAKVAAEKKYYS
jgi:hypothetical protein